MPIGIGAIEPHVMEDEKAKATAFARDCLLDDKADDCAAAILTLGFMRDALPVRIGLVDVAADLDNWMKGWMASAGFVGCSTRGHQVEGALEAHIVGLGISLYVQFGTLQP
jgi:hypothetical protein